MEFSSVWDIRIKTSIKILGYRLYSGLFWVLPNFSIFQIYPAIVTKLIEFIQVVIHYDVTVKKITRKSGLYRAMNKQLTTAIKGGAIILMIIHHCFGFPQWYIGGINYPELQPYTKALANCTQICVSLFAVLTGWVYFKHLDKSFLYSLRKIISFLINFWLILVLLMVLAYFFCQYEPNVRQIINEFIPLKRHPLGIFNWYVIFYIQTMLVIPIFSYLSNKNTFLVSDIMGALGFCFLLYCVNGVSYFKTLRIDFLYTWFPCVMAGYITAKYAIFERVLKSSIFSKRFLAEALALLIIVIVLLILYRHPYYQGIYKGWIAAPLFILSMMVLIKDGFFCHLLVLLGKHSMNIWFIHCLFFSSITKSVFQPYVYYWGSPLLVITVVLGICLLGSLIITPFQNMIVNKILSIKYFKK